MTIALCRATETRTQVRTNGPARGHHARARALQGLLWYILGSMAIISSAVMVYAKTPEVNNNVEGKKVS